ncbi:MAG: DivIVA domain-containing protein [Actinobacteria bacterium]|nr:MAG: DivIVA domain-containing protein [Actinomycetota bacterium]
MKLTPLDIHHKEFKRAIRGYSEEDVDLFLDQVASEFERIFKDNVNFKEEIEKLKSKVGQYENIEQTLQNTLLTAQKSAEEVQLNAKKEAELILKDAELKSKQMLDDSYSQRRTLTNTLNNLTAIEEEFINRFESLTQSLNKKVKEIAKEKDELAKRVEVETKKLPESEQKKIEPAIAKVQIQETENNKQEDKKEQKTKGKKAKKDQKADLKKETKADTNEDTQDIETTDEDKQNTGTITATNEEIDTFLNQDNPEEQTEEAPKKGLLSKLMGKNRAEKEEAEEVEEKV